MADLKSGIRQNPCCACVFGCIGIFLILAVFSAIALYCLFSFVPAMKTKPSIPKVVSPTKEDRKTLEEKVAKVLISSGASALDLTPGEVNALLAQFKPLPAMGLVIEKMWLLTGKGKGLLIIDGSGFWLSDLTIMLEIPSTPKVSGVFPECSRIQINSLEVPGWLSGIANTYISRYIRKTLMKKVECDLPLFDRIDLTEDQISFFGPFPAVSPVKGGN